MTLWYRLILSISDKRREVFLRWLHRRLAVSWDNCKVGVVHFKADGDTTITINDERNAQRYLASGDQLSVTFDAYADLKFKREVKVRHPKET